MYSGVSDTMAQNLVQAFQHGLSGFLRFFLNAIDWIPEAASELNQLINAPDKYEICNPSLEVRHAPVTMLRPGVNTSNNS